VQDVTNRRAAALVGAAFWCALARDAEILLPVAFGIVLLLFALRQRGRDGYPRLYVVTAGLLFLAAGFCVATVVMSGRDTLNTTDNLYVRVFPYPARVAWFSSHGMPEARQIDRLARSGPPPSPGLAKTVFPNLKAANFAPLDRWIDRDGSSTYALWIIEHPWLIVLEPFRTPERTFNDAKGDITSYAALNRVTSGLTPVLWSPWIWILGIAALTLVIFDEKDLVLDRTIQIIVALGLIGVANVFAAWSGDGQETTRHTLEGLAAVHLSVLILFLYVTLTPKPKRSASRRLHGFTGTIRRGSKVDVDSQ